MTKPVASLQPIWVTGLDLLALPTAQELCAIALVIKANFECAAGQVGNQRNTSNELRSRPEIAHGNADTASTKELR